MDSNKKDKPSFIVFVFGICIIICGFLALKFATRNANFNGDFRSDFRKQNNDGFFYYGKNTWVKEGASGKWYFYGPPVGYWHGNPTFVPDENKNK
jgi:hypothetical protein